MFQPNREPDFLYMCVRACVSVCLLTHCGIPESAERGSSPPRLFAAPAEDTSEYVCVCVCLMRKKCSIGGNWSRKVEKTLATFSAAQRCRAASKRSLELQTAALIPQTHKVPVSYAVMISAWIFLTPHLSILYMDI